MAYFITDKCTKCGNCIDVCPTNSITESISKYVIDRDTCSDSSSCVNVCPVDAINKKKEVVIEES